MGVAYIYIFTYSLSPYILFGVTKQLNPPPHPPQVWNPLVWISHLVLDAFSEQSENSTEL